MTFFRTILLVSGVSFVTVGLGEREVWAAASATVTKDGAEVHAQPSDSSPVIDTLPVSTVLRLGNKSQDGWRRAAIPIGDHKGQIGWIRESSVSFIETAESITPEEAAAPAASRRKGAASARVQGGATLSFYSKSTTDSSLATQMSYALQGSYLFVGGLSVGVRATMTSMLVTSEDPTTLQVTDALKSVFSFGLPLEYSLNQSRTFVFSLGAGPTLQLMPSTSLTPMTFGVMGYGAASAYLSRKFFVRLDGGYSLSFATDGAAGAPFVGGFLGIDL